MSKDLLLFKEDISNWISNDTYFDVSNLLLDDLDNAKAYVFDRTWYEDSVGSEEAPFVLWVMGLRFGLSFFASESFSRRPTSGGWRLSAGEASRADPGR